MTFRKKGPLNISLALISRKEQCTFYSPSPTNTFNLLRYFFKGSFLPWRIARRVFLYRIMFPRIVLELYNNNYDQC